MAIGTFRKTSSSLAKTAAHTAGYPRLWPLAAAALWALPYAVQAETYFWSGFGATNNWTNPNNWSGVSAPISDEDSTEIYFQGITPRGGVDLNADWSVSSLEFDRDPDFNTQQSYTLFSDNNSVLTVGGGGIQNFTSKTQTINLSLVLNDSQGWNVDGTLVINGARSGDTAADVTIVGNSGTETVVFGGDGSRQLGYISIIHATLRIGDVDAISASSEVKVGAGATFDLGGTGEEIGALSGDGAVLIGAGHLVTGAAGSSSTFSGRLSGAGQFEKAGAGVQVLSGNNSAFTGAYTVGSGTLEARDVGNALGDTSRITIEDGATLRIAGDGENVGSVAGDGAIELQADLGVGGDNTSTAFAGTIIGNGNLTKNGAGTFNLTGPVNFTGAMTVNGGTLGLGRGVTTDNAVTLNANTLLRVFDQNASIGSLAGTGDVFLDSVSLTVGSNDTSTLFSGRISKIGNLTKNGTGTLLLTGKSTFAGQLFVRGGTLELGVADALANRQAVTVDAGARLKISGGAQNFASLNGAGHVDLHNNLTVGYNNTDGVFSGDIQGFGNFTKLGTGALTLSGGTHILTGNMVVNNGWLKLTDNSQLATVDAVVGALRRQDSVVVSVEKGAAWFNNAMRVGNQGNSQVSVEGGGLIVSQAGEVSTDGSRSDQSAVVTIQGTNSQWAIANDLDLGRLGNGAVAVDGGNLTVGGNLSVHRLGELALFGGSLVADTLTLDGGSFDFLGGTLHARHFIGALVNDAGILAPGNSPGTTEVFGDYQQGARATLEIELASQNLFDVLAIHGGSAHLGGKLVVKLLDGFNPAVGSVFEFLSADQGIVGAFASVLFPQLSGRQFQLQQDATHLFLKVTAAAGNPAPVPLPGAMTLLAPALLVLGLRKRRA